MTEILIVEDEPKIAELLEDYLSAHGYQCHQVHRGDEAIESFNEIGPGLVLLDLMLPGIDGIEVCKLIRRQSSVPVIMVTARVEEIDRLLGLELGADDYICKPFSPREVVARVKAVLRRAEGTGENQEVGGLLLDPGRHEARYDGAVLDLTPVEFSLLQALHGEGGRVLSRSQLMDRMYSDYRVVSDRAVDTHIKNLRKKLDAAAPGCEMIESVYGLGYRYTKPPGG